MFILVLITASAVAAYIIIVKDLKKNYYNVFGAPLSGMTYTYDAISKNDECNKDSAIEYLYYKDKADNYKNNKFGLYIYAENKDFIRLADKLVNSNGGEWGYVLIPFNVRDLSYGKWQEVFDMLLEKKLIPIVQLHDINVDKYEAETENVARFLNSLVWPIKQRYISVYNEPNDAKFWYGRVAPKEYAAILNYTIDSFKEENPNFFMLNGALNVSADGAVQGYMDAFEYMSLMNKYVPGIFSKLDGFASHSYPQPNFSGSPYSQGRYSIRAYEEELEYLRDVLGVKKNLPVFITETGWAHAEGETYNSAFLPVSTTSEYIKKAYQDVWLKDDRVIAVTPFTIWYAPPHDHFSWVNEDKVPYLQYEVIKSLKKQSGTPESLEKGYVYATNCEAN